MNSEALPALSFFQSRQVRPTAWKCGLEIGPDFKIPINGFIKVSIYYSCFSAHDCFLFMEQQNIRLIRKRFWLVNYMLLRWSKWSLKGENTFFPTDLFRAFKLLLPKATRKHQGGKNMCFFYHNISTLSQTTNFRIFQTERVCRRQFQI